MKNIKVIVATHKKYTMPNDPSYLPLHVGKDGNIDLGYLGDDSGDNISTKNPYFSELTGVYWAWKNLNSDYIGLVHYRRYFGNGKKNKNTFDNILSTKEIEELLEETDVILPKKRNYYIETLYSHYKNTLYIEPLDQTEKIINELYPEYTQYFKLLHKRTSAHMFNMFIMKKSFFHKYCQWLFSILFELEKRIDVSQYDPFHSRFYGRISELLLDIWIETNKVKYLEVPLLNMEKTNWLHKGGMFLRAKFTKKKYEKSFTKYSIFTGEL